MTTTTTGATASAGPVVISTVSFLLLLITTTTSTPILGLDSFLSQQSRSDPHATNDTFLSLSSALKKSLSSTLRPPPTTASLLSLQISSPISVKLVGPSSSFPPSSTAHLRSFLSAAVSSDHFHIITTTGNHRLSVTHSPSFDVSLSSSSLSSLLSDKIKSEIATTTAPLRSNLISIPHASVDAIIKHDYEKEKHLHGVYIYLLNLGAQSKPYAYKYTDTGDSSLGITKCSGSIWTGNDRYLWIDLSAGPVDYGPALSGDGVLPRGEFHPLTALHGRPKSQKALLADMASLIWSAYKVLVVPSLRIPVPFENQLIVQFIHIHGPDKDYKGLDFDKIEKNFMDEVNNGGLLFGDQSLTFKKYDVDMADCSICSFAVSLSITSYTSRYLFDNYTLIVSEYLDSKRLHQTLSESHDEIRRLANLPEEDFGRVLPVYIFDLEVNSILLLDRYHQSVAFKDMVIAVRTRNTQTVSDYSCIEAAGNSSTSITTTAATTPTRNSDEILLNLLRQRKTEDAWIAYTQSPQLPNPTCLSRLICQLSYQNTPSALTRAQSIIRRLRHERQLHRLDSNSLGLLAVAAAKSGDTLYANSILKSMLRSGYLPHVKAWSAVVSRLAASGDDGPKEAVKLFSQVIRTIRRFSEPTMVMNSRPDTAAYNAVLNACANLGWTDKFLQLFDEMPENNCEPDILTYNVMIKLCARTDRKELLVFVLEQILEKQIPLCMTTLQSLVASYIGFGDLETAEKIVQAMRDGRRDLCKILKDANLQKFMNEYESEVFEKLLPKMNYPTDHESPLLQKVYTPDTRMYTTLMKGYMKAGRIKDTLRMLEAMRNQEDKSSHPDHVSYTTVVSALVNVGSMEKARQVLTEMTKSGIQANRVTYNILLKGYCQQLQITNARETIKEMIDAGIEPDAVSYNTMIDGCILIDDCAGALEFFNEMRAKGIAPTKISYTTLMKAFSVSGQPKLAHDVFNEMEKDPRVKVDLVAWNMIIEAYGRSGMLDPAKELIEKMKKKGVYPDVATYGSLAHCIALARKPGEALLLWNEIKQRCGLITNDEIKVFKSGSKVPDLKPDEGLLDTLADICVRAAFFKKALEIVAFMEELGIAPNKTKYTRIYVEMHSRMFTSKHASKARQDRRIERKRAAEAFKFWLGLPNSYYGSEWRLEGGVEGVEDDEYAI